MNGVGQLGCYCNILEAGERWPSNVQSSRYRLVWCVYNNTHMTDGMWIASRRDLIPL